MYNAPSPLTAEYLEKIRRFYEKQSSAQLTSAARIYRRILAKYYNSFIPRDASVLEIGCGAGDLLELLECKQKAGIDLSAKQIEKARLKLPKASFFVQAGEELELRQSFDYIIISDTLNYAADVQLLLSKLHAASHESTRLVVNYLSSFWRPFSALITLFRLRAAHPKSSWLTPPDVTNLLRLADWEQIANQPRIFFPISLFGADRLINRRRAPFFFCLCLTRFVTARPRPLFQNDVPQKTVSIIIPARNEADNIRAAVERAPTLGSSTELIFVEGHSSDDTWAKILQTKADFPEKIIKGIRQPGRGKGDAVRAGFAQAAGEILIILDGDLTVPPEELIKFYQVIAEGKADFANGVRLVYPMEKKAMPFLNLCANKMFSLIFTWILGQPVKDTLCGTKALTRAHYLQIAANRAYFGDFDPFGDFDLLFGASKLNLKISDIPIRYQDRKYGTSKIQRWKHGVLLLRIVFFGAWKLKFL